MNRIKFSDKHGQKQRHYYTRACATQRGIVTPFAPGTGEFYPRGTTHRPNIISTTTIAKNCCILAPDSLWLINILRFAYLSAALHWGVILYRARAIAMVGAKSQLRVQKYTDNSGTGGTVIYKRASFCRKWQR